MGVRKRAVRAASLRNRCLDFPTMKQVVAVQFRCSVEMNEERNKRIQRRKEERKYERKRELR
jgi:hypothetical protein